jgi:hypothetical protein
MAAMTRSTPENGSGRAWRSPGSGGDAPGNLGKAYADLGGVRRATGYHEQNLAIAQEIGDRHRALGSRIWVSPTKERQRDRPRCRAFRPTALWLAQLSMPLDAPPDEEPVLAFEPRMRCSECGHLGAGERPDWWRLRGLPR